MPSSQKGFIHVLLLIIMLVGLAVGVFLIQQQTKLRSQASLTGVESSLSLSGYLSENQSTGQVVDDPSVNVNFSDQLIVDVLLRANDQPVNLIIAQLQFPDFLIFDKFDLTPATGYKLDYLDSYVEGNTIYLAVGTPTPGFKNNVGQAAVIAKIYFKVKPNTSLGSSQKLSFLAETAIYQDSDNQAVANLIQRPLNVSVGQIAASSPIPSSAPGVINKKILAVIYDPTVQSGKKLHEEGGWNDPIAQINQIVQAINGASGGFVNYQLEFANRNEWPPLIGKLRQTEQTYKQCKRQAYMAYFPITNTTDCEAGTQMDYAKLWEEQNLCQRVSSGEIDTVFLYGPPYSGWDEFAYKIPGDKFPYNAPTNYWFYQGRTHGIPDCNGKTVLVMGWIYQSGVDNALHSYAHWIETALGMTVGRGSWDATCTQGGDFNKFSCINKDIKSSSPTNIAGCGNAHFPPNGLSDYDYANQTKVSYACESYLNYPFATPVVKNENCSAWGCNQLGYIKWYMSHLPKSEGVTDDGNLKNWWKYIVDFDNAVKEAKATPTTTPLPSPTPVASGGSCSGKNFGFNPSTGACQEYQDICVPIGVISIKAPSCQLAGDFQGDGKFSIGPNWSIFFSAFTKQALPERLQKADLNGDGVVNSFDFSIMKSIYISKGKIRSTK